MARGLLPSGGRWPLRTLQELRASLPDTNAPGLGSDVDGKGTLPGQARTEWFYGFRRRIGFMDIGSVY